MKECSVDGCSRTKLWGNGMCDMHNKRIARTGSAEKTKISRKGASISETLSKYSIKNEDTGCIEWTGKTDMYGQGVFTQKHISTAHKAAWIAKHGDIKTQTKLAHTCNNPKCINVDHLRVINSVRMEPEDITQAFLRTILDYDELIGEFTWKIKRSSNALAGKKAGCASNSGYIRINICKRLYLAHRLAWLYVNGEWPSEFMDHIDGNGLNNSISNLREATLAENNENQRKAKSSSTTGMLGAYLRKDTGRWYSAIGVNGKRISLGCFDTPDEAHSAYVEAKRKYHSFCTI